MTLQEKIRTAMRTGGDLKLSFDPSLNTKSPGAQNVYLHAISENEIKINLTASGGEASDILWLPWRQGELPSIQEFSISAAKPETLFLTYELSGCKLFGIKGGPFWHIDAQVSVSEFWPGILSSEWVEDYWPAGSTQDVAYLHRLGQSASLWDLSQKITGNPPTTYGSGNVGNAFVGGIVNTHNEIDLYYQASPWSPLKYTQQTMKK